MTRIKLGLLGFCAVVLGMMTISAGSAQAALSWLILRNDGQAIFLKALLKSEVDTETLASGDVSLLSKEVNIPFAITCTGFELIGVNLETGGTLTTGGKAKFTGCEAYGTGILSDPLGCHVHSSGFDVNSGVVETGPGKGELVLHELVDGGKEVLAKWESNTGPSGTLATFLTMSCSIPEINPVHGVLYFADCTERVSGKCISKATTHLIKHLIIQGPLTSLWVGADTSEHLETSFDGSAWIKLAGTEHVGLTWGAMDA